jgi:tRNA threonylcarbamoyladenosine biosynthesis protein TsaB
MLLAIDSSSVTAGAALVRADTRPAAVPAEVFLCNGLTHSHTLAPLIDSLLNNAGVSPGEITQVAVTNGPGSFTGLRIGVATALGFAAGLGIPCAGVSSLMAAAYGAADRDGTICAAMDARRGQIYCAAFSAENGTLRRLTKDDAMNKNDFIRKLSTLNCQLSNVIWTGDAAELCAKEGGRAAARPYVTGFGTALCFLNGHSRPADKIEYLRMPQAERERLERETINAALPLFRRD